VRKESKALAEDSVAVEAQTFALLQRGVGSCKTPSEVFASLGCERML